MFELNTLVKAKLYSDENAVLQDALRHLFRARPELRIQVAIYRYQEEKISLAKAAALAGVSWAQMKDILLEKGIEPCLGHDNIADAEAEIHALREYFKS